MHRESHSILVRVVLLLSKGRIFGAELRDLERRERNLAAPMASPDSCRAPQPTLTGRDGPESPPALPPLMPPAASPAAR